MDRARQRTPPRLLQHTIMMSLAELIDFIRLTNQFSQTHRTIRKPGTEVFENDAEHSYQLTMVAWHIVNENDLPYDLNKILRYALVHDLPEVHTGDFPTHEKNFDTSVKESRERASFQKLKQQFGNTSEIIKTYEDYEQRDDGESKFVYALDKVLPNINIYLDGYRAWEEVIDGTKQDIDWSLANYSKKISTSPEVDHYWQEFLKLIEPYRNQRTS